MNGVTKKTLPQCGGINRCAGESTAVRGNQPQCGGKSTALREIDRNA